MIFQVIGPVVNPIASGYGDLAGGGLIAFISNIVKLLILAGGIWAFINIVIAGFRFITASGDPKSIEGAWKTIIFSIIGLVVMVSSYLLAYFLGIILFGDGDAILSPDISGI